MGPPGSFLLPELRLLCWLVQLALFLPGLEIAPGRESCSACSGSFPGNLCCAESICPKQGPVQKPGITEPDHSQALACRRAHFTGFLQSSLRTSARRTSRGRFHGSLSLHTGFESPAGPTPSPSAPPASPWQGRSVASSKLWMLEFSAFLERQQDPDTVCLPCPTVLFQERTS